MITLKYIKDEIQKIAEAIEAVLEIDVTIVDENLVRVAGTGIYVEKLGQKVNGYSAFKKSIIEQSSNQNYKLTNESKTHHRFVD